MDDRDAEIRGLRLEWLAARIVGALGFVAVAATISLLVVARIAPSPPPAPPPPAQDESADTPPQQDEHAQGLVLCTTAFANAVNYGILPKETRIDDAGPKEGRSQGRYICHGAAGAAKYEVAFDLMCSQIADQRCIRLFRVGKDGGAVLFQRQD